MINEMKMKNVYKIELRSPNKISYDALASWLHEKGVCHRPVRGKFDTYWFSKYVQIELSVDSMYIGGKEKHRAWESALWVFDNLVVKEFMFSNIRQVKTDINNRYDDDGLDQIVYAKTRK